MGICGQRGGQAPKTTRVPVDGITRFRGIAAWTAMIVFRPLMAASVSLVGPLFARA